MEQMKQDCIESTIFGLYLRLAVNKRNLLIPHFSVSDLDSINPEKLKEAGFKGIVWGNAKSLCESKGSYQKFESFKQFFNEDSMVIVSNHVGARGDKDYGAAKMVEDELGIEVVRHPSTNKPWRMNSFEKMFPNTSSDELVMIGDSPLTDMVFGNRYSMLTIQCSDRDISRFSVKLLGEEGLTDIKSLYNYGMRAPEQRLYRDDLCTENLLKETNTRISRRW